MKRLAIGLACAIVLLGAPKRASATSLIHFLGFGKAIGNSATPPSANVLVTLTDAAIGGISLAGFNQRPVS